MHSQYAAQHCAQREGPGQEKHSRVPQALAEAQGAGAGLLVREQLLEESSASAAAHALGLEQGFVLLH